MNKVSISGYKGTRDFYPEDKRLQNHIFNVWDKVCQSYGYSEYNGPMLESLDLYLLKNQDNQEIINEQIYNFTDRGNRQVAIRPEMTPTVSRMVAAKSQELSYPLRWYSKPNLWRYERPQKGRLREHWQLNVDIFGDYSISSDLEMLLIANSIMTELGANSDDFVIKINSKGLTDAWLDQCNISQAEKSTVIGLIDKYHKIGVDKFKTSLIEALGESQTVDNCIDFIKSDINSIEPEFKDNPDYKRLIELMQHAKHQGISNIEYDPTIVRGFAYYTGFVFEVYDTHPDNNRAMFGGGRYDGLVEALGGQSTPTVGFGMGDVTVTEFIKNHDLIPEFGYSVDYYLAVESQCLQTAADLRQRLQDKGHSVSIDFSQRKLPKLLDAADKHRSRYFVYIGQQEASSGKFTVRDMADGQTAELAD